MGIGDAPLPVASDAEVNNPVPPITRDSIRKVDERVKTLELSLNPEIIRQIKFLYDNLVLPYPPPP